MNGTGFPAKIQIIQTIHGDSWEIKFVNIIFWIILTLFLFYVFREFWSINSR